MKRNNVVDITFHKHSLRRLILLKILVIHSRLKRQTRFFDIYYVIDPSLRSLQTACEISAQLSHARFIPVINLAVGDCRKIPGSKELLNELASGTEIVMPTLAPEIRAWTEADGFTWSGFLMGRHDDIPYETRIVIMDFLEAIYNQSGAQDEEFR